MRKKLYSDGTVQSIVEKHHQALEQAISHLAQAVGNHPPERDEIAGFFQKLIDGDWDAYAEATAREDEDMKKRDRDILQLQEKICQTMDGGGKALFDQYEELLNCRMTSELEQAYLVGYQTAIRLLLMGILPPTIFSRNSQNVSEKGDDDNET